MEAALDALLKTICPRVFPDEAKEDTQAPYIVWQGIGGASLRTLDGDACNSRNTYMQISVWSTRRLEALSLIRQIEDALVASSSFRVVRPDSEPISAHETDPDLYGSIQRFSIWSNRS
jgi:hypothetical protein